MLNFLFFLIVGFVVFDYLLGSILSWLNRRSAKPTLPHVLDGIYDSDEYAKQQLYFKENNRFTSVVRSFEFILMLCMLFVGGFGIVDSFAYSVTPSPVLASLLFFAIIFWGNDLLVLPFDYYDNFVIEQKFGFNTMTRRIFFADKAKGWLIGALLGGALLAVIFLLFQQWRELFWIYSWVLIAGVSLFFTMFYSEWIVPLFNKQTPLAPGELKDAINDFAKKVGFEISNIYVIDGSKRSTKANAYFTGFGKKKRVVLYDTLIKELTTEQIVAVLAHEIGHYKHNHTHIGFLLSLANTFILLYVFSLVVDSELLAKAMGGKFPTFELGLIAFTLLYSPIELILGIALNAISRKHEYQADRFAAANGLGEALIDGLKKISVSSLSNLTPSKAYVFVYYSHPTLLQRIDSIKKWQSNNIKNVIDTNINIQ